MNMAKLLGLGLGGVGCLLLMGCAGTTTYSGTDYYVRDHVYVDRYHRHYHPPRYYPVHPYRPHDGGFSGGGGHPDRGGRPIGSAPAPVNHGGGFSGGNASAPPSHSSGFSGGSAPPPASRNSGFSSDDKPSSGGFSGGKMGS